MRLKEITELFEREFPTSMAMDWDNVGLQVGDLSQEINRVYVALDATDEVIEHAINAGADLLITHHPLIFTTVNRVVANDMVGRRLLKMIENHMAYYAMHTNFDIAAMGDIVAKKMGVEVSTPLEPTGEYADGKSFGMGFVGELVNDSAVNLKEFADSVRDNFGLSHVKIFSENDKMVKRIACCPGSGKSVVNFALEAGADVYVTGDIDHHTGIDAVAMNLPIIDAGHYGLEHVYIDYMVNLLRDNLPELKVTEEGFKEPFWID